MRSTDLGLSRVAARAHCIRQSSRHDEGSTRSEVPHALDAASARLIEDWYLLADAPLRVMAPRQTPILWPEHHHGTDGIESALDQARTAAAARTSHSRAARKLRGSTSRRTWSTRCRSTWCRSSSATGNDSSMTWASGTRGSPTSERWQRQASRTSSSSEPEPDALPAPAAGRAHHAGLRQWGWTVSRSSAYAALTRSPAAESPSERAVDVTEAQCGRSGLPARERSAQAA